MAGEYRSCERKDVKMGRSKFPGKPNKINNKRRVNLSSCQLPEHNDSSKAAESICMGLSVFKETFVHSGLGKHNYFAGFEAIDIDEAKAESRLQQREAEAESKRNGFIEDFWTACQNEVSTMFNDVPTSMYQRPKTTNMCFDGGGSNNTPKKSKVAVEDAKSPIMNNACADTRLTRAVKRELDNSSVLKAKRKLVMNSPVPKSLQSQAAKKLLMKAKKVNVVDGSKGGLEKKFVLPSRSAHSSRVIKPNKRFLEDERLPEDAKPASDKTTSPLLPVLPTAVTASNQNRTGGKVILREARLQLDSTPCSLGEGPFSSPGTSSLAPSPQRLTTIACGICGAVKFYKFVKQMRKFGVLCCEPCRKFISRIVRRRASISDTGLKCIKGTGICMVPAVVRNAQWRSSGVGCSGRCQACWLKLCLRTFQIPSDLKQSLQMLLPPDMRTELKIVLPDSNLFSLSDNSISFFKSFTGVPPIPKPAEEKVKKDSKKGKHEKRKDGKTKHRQRVPVPGPRVKHVCRSASVVLGQSLATFPELTPPKECCEDAVEAVQLPPPLPVEKIEKPRQKDEKPAAVEEIPAKRPVSPVQAIRRKKSEPNPAVNLVSMDFWEIYDPEEVCETGFSLIGSEPFSVRALCYLCGSAGLEQLVHCASCCEPYHEFCVSDSGLKKEGWKYDWVCPRCTLCAACCRPSGQQLKCVRCDNSYHTECVGGRLLHSPDRPWVCSSCLRCKSCNAVDVSVFVGNLPLCKPCFLLRQKGNFCPLCQRCYEDDDYDCKMMECGGCQSWVHAKCEGISDEKYQVLSFLPESVEFICRMCCVMPPAPWWLAVEGELRAGYLGVLKALSKNRTACRMLKWSPRKVCSCRRKEASRVTQEEDSLDSVRRESPPPASDSGIGSADDEFKLPLEEGDCFCFLEVDSYNSRSKPFSPNLLTIKKKVTTNEYSSLTQFHEDMQAMIETAQSEELMEAYHSAIKEVFPWFDARSARILGASRCGSLENSPVKASPLKSAPILSSLVPVNTLEGRPIEYFYNDSGIVDTRSCVLCKQPGDGISEQAGRLLYCGQNEWVHCNCALWSGEVFEEIDGSLQNVHSAISRGRKFRCPHCQLKGASVGCCARSCAETYHFSCARAIGCVFLDDKSVYCPVHVSETAGRLLQSEKDYELRRPVYVELDKRRSKPVDVMSVRFTVGALHVDSLGRFVPEVSDLPQTIMPADFLATRLFWSSREPWRLVQYRFSVRCWEPELTEGIDLGVNLTVEHALSDVEARLRQLKHFQLHHTLLPLEPVPRQKRIKRRIFDPLDEPDNQDLFPPEIEEAILKELSHDILEGISVQDIFQDMSERERDEDGLEDDLLSHGRPRKTTTLRSGNWNAKVEKPEKGDAKWKRKTQEGKENKMLGWCARLLQVDGTVDSSSGSEAGESPGRTADIPADIPQLDGAEDSDYESCDGLPETDESPVECEKCRCTYRTQRSYERHLESRCHDLLLSSSEEEDEPSPPPPPPSMKPPKPQRTYTRKKPPAVTLAAVPPTAPSILVPPSPMPMILQEMPTYQPMVQYIVEQQKPLIVPNTYQVVLPPSPVVLGTPSPMFEVVTDPHTGGMYLTQPSTQPLLYNMETIVSNTVMQTNQFVSSSFSQTSTQVFQASKQVMNVPTGYVIAPNDLICVPVTSPMTQPQPMRPQWTPPKPKPPVIRKETPPKPPPQVQKVKPRSRALVDYINNFRSDGPDSLSVNNDFNVAVAKNSMQQRKNIPTAVARKMLSQSSVRVSMPTTTTAPTCYGVSSSPRLVAQAQPIVKPLVSLPKPQPLPREPSPSYALSISMPSLDDTPPQSCDNSPSLPQRFLQPPPPVNTVKFDDAVFSQASFAAPVNTIFNSYTQSSPLLSVSITGHENRQLSHSASGSHSNQTITNYELSMVPLQHNLPSPRKIDPPSPFLSPQVLQKSPSYTPPHSIASTSALHLESYQPLNRPLPVASSSVMPTTSTPNPPLFSFPPTKKPAETVALQALQDAISKSMPASTQLHDTALPISIAPLSNTCRLPLREQIAVDEAPVQPVAPKPVVINQPVQPLAAPPQPRQIPHAKCEPLQLSDQNKSCLKELKITPRIVEPEGPKLIYDVVADDGFKFSSSNLGEVWQKICESVQEIRAAYRMPPLPMAPRSYEALGMNNHGLQHLLEQLPNVGFCKKYQARYFKQPPSCDDEHSPVKENATGSARSEGYFERKEVDKFGWLASRHRKLPRLSPTSEAAPPNRKSNNLPVAMKYRQLRESSKMDMFVYRSKIHGMGLFCLREIEAGEMVIEYSGEVIRSFLTDKREKYYTDKGIGCYMFRIDEHTVIDATMKGNAARFINHSCEPNCYSKIVDILGKKHIIIYALRRIAVMEELTYDYKFPFEEDKISCHCLSKKCRKYLN